MIEVRWLNKRHEEWGESRIPKITHERVLQYRTAEDRGEGKIWWGGWTDVPEVHED